MSVTSKTVSYECLYDADGVTFYAEGYSSLKKAKEVMNGMIKRSRIGVDRNFRIVRHETIDTETIVKTYEVRK